MITAVMPTYGRADIAFDKGEGAYLLTADGRRYLDFASGVAVTALGHCHPHLVEALKLQAETVWHTSNLFNITEQEKLAERLVASSFADSVFFSNSGTEAVECGLKMVRRYNHLKGQPEKNRVITCTGSFHGRTLAPLAAAGKPAHLDGFAPMMDGFDHVPFGNLNELRAAITDNTAAILVEPIQGEGGIHPAPMEFLKGIRKACDEFGLLMFLDEVQTGMGRTGKLFAYEWAGIKPDIVSLAKGLGGGFPIGACLATEEAALALTAGSHGSTFGGNPLACAVGNAVLDVMLADGFLDSVNAMSDRLMQGLAKLIGDFPEVFSEVRGKGLLIGLQCVGEAGPMIGALRDNGLLTVPAEGNVVRLIPPLIIDQSHVDECLEILDKTCREISEAS